jgi:hypothetical protein
MVEKEKPMHIAIISDIPTNLPTLELLGQPLAETTPESF